MKWIRRRAESFLWKLFFLKMKESCFFIRFIEFGVTKMA